MLHKMASSRSIKLVAAFLTWFEHAGVVAINVEWLSRGSLAVVAGVVIVFVVFSVKERLA